MLAVGEEGEVGGADGGVGFQGELVGKMADKMGMHLIWMQGYIGFFGVKRRGKWSK